MSRKRGESSRAEPIQPRISALCARHALPPAAGRALCRLLSILVDDPLAPTAIREEQRAIDDHLADSLVALELAAVRSATEIVDLGSGAGLPGLPLAIALPSSSFVLLEAAARRCAFIERAARECAAANVRVVCARAEEWEEGRERFDLAIGRAVAPFPVLVEYAAPLLRVGGTLVAWRGRREPEVERAAARAAERLGMVSLEVRPVFPYEGACDRHLHLMSKVMATPAGFPRRPGAALKRPLGVAPAGPAALRRGAVRRRRRRRR